eukprot:tig00001376_g8547.t1
MAFVPAGAGSAPRVQRWTLTAHPVRRCDRDGAAPAAAARSTPTSRCPSSPRPHRTFAPSDALLVRASGDDVPVREALDRRFSCRGFDASRTATADQILSCLKAGQLAPSAYNEQPFRFVVALNGGEGWEGMLASLMPKNQENVKNASALVAVCACKNFLHSGPVGQPNEWRRYDAGAAAMALELRAASLGLASLQMAGFEEGALRRAAGIPHDAEPMAVVAIGYPAAPRAPQPPPPPHIAFGAGRWGSPLEEPTEMQ